MPGSTRWFRKLVRLLPADFQADYARDVLRTAPRELRSSASGSNILDWQDQATSVTAIAAYRRRSINLSGAGEPRYVHAAVALRAE